MNEKQIKRKLEDKGFLVIDVARAMSEEFPTLKVSSATTILHEMFKGNRYIEKYAVWLKENYGVSIEKPNSAKPVRERMKLQVA
ncbi:MAG: hypothetical protein MUC29_14630 [Pyrinomonadaceae bacterium]|jgi:hypothetical protein|nr:hypothetical protein [Pyrinomonadaceae bacterium]